MKNILRSIMRAIRKLNYTYIGDFRDGKALALVFVMWNYNDPDKNMAVVVVDEDYKMIEWTNYRSIEQAEKAIYGDK